MKKLKTKYAVFTNYNVCVGLLRRAWSLEDLFENLPKWVQRSLSHVQYRDEEGRMIQITHYFMEDQGMTIQECIDDWIENMEDQFDEEIHCMNPNDVMNRIIL